jgi:hypothetical protein
MVEIKARGAAKAELTNVNEHFAATNNAEFGLFQQNLASLWRESARDVLLSEVEPSIPSS